MSLEIKQHEAIYYGKLDDFFVLFGEFKELKVCALSRAEFSYAKDALEYLKNMFELIPEKFVKLKLPNIYRKLEEDVMELSDLKNYR